MIYLILDDDKNLLSTVLVDAPEDAEKFKSNPTDTLLELHGGYYYNQTTKELELISSIVPEPAPKVITKLELMNRFTQEELEGIYSAAKNNVTAEIWLEKFKLAESINLSDPGTIGGFDVLVAASLLSAERKDAILNS